MAALFGYCCINFRGLGRYQAEPLFGRFGDQSDKVVSLSMFFDD